MPLSPVNRKRLRIAAICLGVLTVIIGVASIFVDQYFQPIIKQKIKETLTEATDSLYTVNFSTLRFNVLTGNIQIKDIELKPNMPVYGKMQEAKTAPNNLYTVSVKRIEMKGVRSVRLYLKRELRLSAIIVNEPSLRVVFENNRNEDYQKKDNRSVYDRIKKVVKSIGVKRIQMRGVDFRYVNLSHKKPTITSFKNLELNARDILIDSLSAKSNKRFLFCRDINAELSGYKSTTPNRLYTYGFRRLSFSTEKQYLLIQNLEFIPNYPKITFSQKLPVQKDRYVIRFDTVRLNRIDFKTLNNYQKLRAGELRIAEGSVDVFLNRNRPAPDINKAENYPHIALKRLDLDTKIDSITLQDVDISYTELDKKSKRSGMLTFKNLGGSIYNVTTSPRYLAENNTAKASLSTFLMGSGRLDVNMTFNLTDPKGAFTYKGALGFMPLHVLNPVTKSLGFIEISSGAINRVNFDMQGDVNGARGKVIARYNNLSVKLLKKKEESDRLIRRGLVSLFANALVIKSDNPTPGEEVRETSAEYIRPKGASFFNVMWKTVFFGLKEAVGITPDKENEISRRVDHINDLKQFMEGSPEKKARREQRKAERKRKRAIRKARES